MVDEAMVRFLRSLPKADLHLHLEGSLSPETVAALASTNGLDSFRTVAEVQRSLAERAPGLGGFLSHFKRALSVLQTGHDFFQATYSLLQTCRDDGVVYVELSFDPQAHTTRGIAFDEVIEGIDEGRRAAESLGIRTGLIMSINRERSVESAFEVLDQASPHRDKLIALGLDSGPEDGNPPSKFEAVFQRARGEGYRLTAHCDVDQQDSIRHIWQCLDLIGVDRVDHGINAFGDPRLVVELKQRGIALTACPVQRSTDPQPQDLDRIKGLFDTGVCISLNTDDPAQFDSGYPLNLLLNVQRAGGYSRADMARFAMNGFEGSFLSEPDKAEYVEAVRSFITANEF